MRNARRYLRLLIILVKVGLMKQTAYRPHFFMMIIGKTVRIGLLFFFFQAIFFKVSRIGDWSYDHVLLLFATFHIVDYLMSITYQRNLAFSLPRRIQTGELDARMTLPVNLLFFVSFEDVDMIDFFSFLPSLGFLIYVFWRLDVVFSWPQAISYVLLLLNALLFLYALMLIIATTSFWTTQAYGLAVIVDQLLKIGRYPLDVLEGFWKVIFIYVLPLVVIAQIPSQALLRTLSVELALYALAVTGLFLAAAIALWRWGLRDYLSAGT